MFGLQLGCTSVDAAHNLANKVLQDMTAHIGLETGGLDPYNKPHIYPRYNLGISIIPIQPQYIIQ